jgi:hypothetical protein
VDITEQPFGAGRDGPRPLPAVELVQGDAALERLARTGLADDAGAADKEDFHGGPPRDAKGWTKSILLAKEKYREER